MFKKSKATPGERVQAAMPTPDPLQVAAEKERARGAAIGALAEEAQMWRAFGASCKPGRILREDRLYLNLGNYGETMSTSMDEITAELWKAFAAQMTAVAEKRLREILG